MSPPVSPDTKAALILDPFSPWNQAPNDEPVCVVRASEWREVLFMALRMKPNTEPYRKMYATAMRMKAYSDENDIPF